MARTVSPMDIRDTDLISFYRCCAVRVTVSSMCDAHLFYCMQKLDFRRMGKQRRLRRHTAPVSTSDPRPEQSISLFLMRCCTADMSVPAPLYDDVNRVILAIDISPIIPAHRADRCSAWCGKTIEAVLVFPQKVAARCRAISIPTRD